MAWLRCVCGSAVLWLLAPAVVWGQEQPRGWGNLLLQFRVHRDTLEIQLPHQFIQPLSDSLAVEGVRPLVRNVDYTLRHAAGLLTLRRGVFDSLPSDTSAVYTLIARYQYLPFRLSGTYSRHRLVVLRDSLGADSVEAPGTGTSFALDDIFGRDLQKSGSLTRGFTVGTNRDLSLSSGFRMQLAGRIGSDLVVAASLTDENTPIQPEGATQTLQEFDNVFVELRSTAYAATLGDFTLDMQGTEFARLTRKLQGARGTASLAGEEIQGQALISGAITRGKYQTNYIQGSEGIQGPYRLTGRDGERLIIVIAGTEKVFVDGVLQIRGETNDYVIDYSTGEIRFSQRRLINSASRIVVDFEYTDRRFSRSLAAVQTGASFLDSRGNISVAFLREADDPDAPIDLVLSDSARRVLSAAGADPSKAVLNGVTRVDSNGQYLQIDSVLADGSPVQFYRFDPGNPEALYNITFSFIGAGKGDYVRLHPGEFAWVSPGGGEYLPIILLPFPRSQQILDIRAGAVPLPAITISAEFARSEVDVNRLSTADAILGGHALNFAASIAPRGLHIGDVSLGDLDITLRERFVDSHFAPVDRINEIEFDRKWGIDSSHLADEEIQEAGVRSIPMPGLSVGGGYGKIDRGEDFRSVRAEGWIDLRQAGKPAVQYRIERIRTEDRTTENRGLWVRHHGTGSWDLSWCVPSFRFEAEDRILRPFDLETINDGSFRYLTYAPGAAFNGFGPIAFTGTYEWRTDERALGGSIVEESRSFTQAYAARLRDTGPVSSFLDLTVRKKVFTPEFRQAGTPDVRSVLIRNQTRLIPWNRALDIDFLYQVTTERSARLERVFVRVARGAGSYRYRGDLNGNGLADEEEFELVRFDGDFTPLTVASDDQIPVIDLKTGLRIRLQPSRLAELGTDGAGAVLRAITSETYFRVEEKSTETDQSKIYLLNLSRFQQEGTTLTGSNLFSQDILILDGNPLFSSRVRFLQRTGLTRFSSGVERSFARERSVRLRWQFVQEVAGQVDLVNRNDRVNAGVGSPRSREVTSDAITLDFAYRPARNVEIGWKLDLAHAVDDALVPVLTSDFNGQTFRLVYEFLGAGQARLEAAREEIILGTAIDVFPFELTGGRVEGKTWLWRAAMEYRMTQFLQGSANYEGRVEGGRSPINTVRAEVRAFF
jgi:hypothetical protein